MLDLEFGVVLPDNRSRAQINQAIPGLNCKSRVRSQTRGIASTFSFRFSNSRERTADGANATASGMCCATAPACKRLASAKANVLA